MSNFIEHNIECINDILKECTKIPSLELLNIANSYIKESQSQLNIIINDLSKHAFYKHKIDTYKCKIDLLMSECFPYTTLMRNMTHDNHRVL